LHRGSISNNCSLTPISLTALVVTATVILVPTPVLAGKYEIVKGKGMEVCEEYEKNLNSFQPHHPMLCDRLVNPEFKDLQKPEWERLDFDKNLDLIVTIDKLLRPGYFRAKPEIRVPTLRGNVEQENYKYQTMVVDIDNDGKTEPVLRFVESCWPGSPRLGGAALVVLQQGKKEVDLKKSELIAQYGLTSYSHGMRDIFLYKEKSYFDNWSIWSMDTGQLHVMRIENGETKEICKMKFIPKQIN
jgi:hypothetical protein